MTIKLGGELEKNKTEHFEIVPKTDWAVFSWLAANGTMKTRENGYECVEREKSDFYRMESEVPYDIRSGRVKIALFTSENRKKENSSRDWWVTGFATYVSTLSRTCEIFKTRVICELQDIITALIRGIRKSAVW